MKIVLDNNVLISGIFWKGAPHRILRLAEKGEISLVTSPQILQELIEVLGRPKFAPYLRAAGISARTAVNQFMALAQIVSVDQNLQIITADPSDNKFISCAVACGASFIVSGDRHLLALKTFAGIEILLPAQFLKRFAKID